MALNASELTQSPWFGAYGSQAQSIRKSFKLTSSDFSIDMHVSVLSSHLENRGVIFSLKLEDMKRGHGESYLARRCTRLLDRERSDSMIVTRR